MWPSTILVMGKVYRLDEITGNEKRSGVFAPDLFSLLV
jgi:hypothetical protein